MSARSVLVALVACTSLGLAACGSSSDAGSSGGSGSGSSGTLTRAQLAVKADAICANAKASASKIAPPTDFGAKGSDPVKAADYLGSVLPITQKEEADFAALQPDAEAKTDWDAVVAGQKSLTDLLAKIVAKAKDKDKSGLKDLAGAAALGKPFIAATTKIGAKGCAAG